LYSHLCYFSYLQQVHHERVAELPVQLGGGFEKVMQGSLGCVLTDEHSIELVLLGHDGNPDKLVNILMFDIAKLSTNYSELIVYSNTPVST
jgi:hypothetical protein